METPGIAVLLTCHSRREATLEALGPCDVQEGVPDVQVYLVDAGSSDGTAQAVMERFPDTRVITVAR